MSTQPFGQQPAFGAPTFGQAPVPTPVDDPEVSTRRRAVVIAVTAGFAALAVLGGAAFLVLPGSDDDVALTALPPAAVLPAEPSPSPSTADAPLPAVAPLGRNVFVPLVDESAAAAAPVDPLSEPVATPAPTPTATTSPVTVPLAFPTVSPTQVPVIPGFGPSAPLPAPTVTVTETVKVPGPTVTSPPKVVEVTVPGFHSLSVTVQEHLVEAEEPRYLADFWLVDEKGEEPAKYEDQDFGDDFGSKNRFVYLSYAPKTEDLTFRYVDSTFTITVPLTPPDTVPNTATETSEPSATS